MVGFATALTIAGGLANAAPAEPLIVADLPDPVLQVVALRDPEADAAGEDVRRFARTLDEAAMAQRQVAAERCRSILHVPATGSVRDAWEANCRYTRR